MIGLTIALFATLGSVLGHAQEVPVVKTISPQSVFTLPVPPGFRIEYMQVTNSSLYLFGRASRTSAELIRTDFSGRLVGRVALPPRVSRVVVDTNDNAIALVSDGKTTKVLEVASTGMHREVILKHRVDNVAPLDGQVIGWTNGMIYLQVTNSQPVVLDGTGIRYPSLAVLLDRHRVGMIDAETPQLWVLTSRGRVQHARLEAPELKPEPRTAHGGVHLTIYGVATNGFGDILCAVSPYRPAEGGVVLQFNDQGILKERYRLNLPGEAQTQGAHMVLSHMAARHKQLYVTSMAGTRCAVYQLPFD